MKTAPTWFFWLLVAAGAANAQGTRVLAIADFNRDGVPDRVVADLAPVGAEMPVPLRHRGGHTDRADRADCAVSAWD